MICHCPAAQIGIAKDRRVGFCVDELQTVEATQRRAAGGLRGPWKGHWIYWEKQTGNCRNPIFFMLFP